MPAVLKLRRGEAGYDAWVSRTDGPLLALAVALVVVLALPYAVHLSNGAHVALTVANVGIWAAFAVDYAVRLWLARTAAASSERTSSISWSSSSRSCARYVRCVC